MERTDAICVQVSRTRASAPCLRTQRAPPLWTHAPAARAAGSSSTPSDAAMTPYRRRRCPGGGRGPDTCATCCGAPRLGETVSRACRERIGGMAAARERRIDRCDCAAALSTAVGSGLDGSGAPVPWWSGVEGSCRLPCVCQEAWVRGTRAVCRGEGRFWHWRTGVACVVENHCQGVLRMRCRRRWRAVRPAWRDT